MPFSTNHLICNQSLFQFCDTPLDIRCLDGAQLQTKKGSQASPDPGGNPASIDIVDQPSHHGPHRQRVIQAGQRSQISPAARR
jgi:hypothetical protein